MLTDLNETLLAALADMFASKKVNSESIGRYLKLICDEFYFDCGFVYEIDQNNVFCLKEHCVSHDTPFHKDFSIESISPDMQAYLTKEPLLYIRRESAKAPHEIELLDFFFAASLAVVAVVDDSADACGFLVFAGSGAEKKLPGSQLRLLSILLNMLERNIGARTYHNKLCFAQDAFESILDNTGIDIYVNDFYTHEILYVNKSMAAPYGGKKQFMGTECWKTLFPGQSGPCEFCPQHNLIDEEGNPTRVYSWDYQRPFDGSWFRVFSSAFRWVDGRLAHVVSSADITENKRNEALIHYMANYDPLTDLPNRRMLVSECERRINHANPGKKGYVLFFDIDGFKAINDNYGHDAGDEFLIQLGKFFTSIPMLKGAIYRNGGDEFVAVIGDDVTEANIRSLSAFIHERFKKPWTLKHGIVYCNTSIGVACYPEDGTSAETLVNKADQAMYQVKKAGGAGICFGYELLPQ